MTDIEADFARHKVPEDIQEKIKDDACLALSIGDIAKEYFREEKRVKRLLLKNKILHHFVKAYSSIVLDSSDYDKCLERDAEYLDELIEHIEDHEDYLIAILEGLNEENWKELLKVLDFSVMHYANNYNYIQGKRRRLDYALNGMNYIDNRNQDTREEFREWFQKVMEQDKTKKQLKKKV